VGIKGAIFDLDGVIVDTVPLHFSAWKKMFESYGHSFTMQDYLAKVDGKPRLAGAASVLTELSPAQIKEAGDKKQRYYLELLDSGKVRIFQSSVKLIQELKSRGIKLAAASSSKNAVRILKKIGLYETFAVNVSGSDFKKGKPDPEIFLTAAQRLGVKPAESVVFEDAKSGVQAALNGGFFCVAIDRHGHPESLAGAQRLVKDLSEINVDEILTIGKE
jgi:beta-phosphoglucomutase